MKSTVILAIVIMVCLSSGAAAGTLPSEFSYTILKEGKQIGTSTTRVETGKNTYIFATNTLLDFSPFELDLNTTTEVDNKSFVVRKFTYDGVRMGKIIEGEFVINGAAIDGWTSDDGDKTPYSRTSDFPRVLLLEDYVMCHEVIIANAYTASGEDPAEFGLFMPTSGNITTVQITKGSVTALESETQEAICTKLLVAMGGSSAFASFFDPERGLPVYLAFPAANVEVFLDDFYGDTPISRFRDK
jgi:hypothetical protein